MTTEIGVTNMEAPGNVGSRRGMERVGVGGTVASAVRISGPGYIYPGTVAWPWSPSVSGGIRLSSHGRVCSHQRTGP